MSADKERIAELERETAELKSIRVSDALAGQSAIDESDNLIVELKRKLAEQQALFSLAMDAAIELAEKHCEGELAWGFNEAKRNAPSEELNNLLAKAKEEGRKEAVPEGWQVVPKSPTDTGAGGMVNAGAIALKQHDDTPFMENRTGVAAFVYTQMLAAAPKPQGETSCQ